MTVATWWNPSGRVVSIRDVQQGSVLRMRVPTKSVAGSRRLNNRLEDSTRRNSPSLKADLKG